MKKWKQVFAVVLAICFSLSLASCGGGSGDPQGGGGDGATDHDRQIVYGSASMIVNFNMKYITAGNDIAAADQVYDTLIRKING